MELSISEQHHHELYNILESIGSGRLSFIGENGMEQRYFLFYYGRYFSLSNGSSDVIPFRSYFSYDEMNRLLSKLQKIECCVNNTYQTIWEIEKGLLCGDIKNFLPNLSAVRVNQRIYTLHFLEKRLNQWEKQQVLAIFNHTDSVLDLIAACPESANLYVDYPNKCKYNILHSNFTMYSEDGDSCGYNLRIRDILQEIQINLDNYRTTIWTASNGTLVTDVVYYVFDGDFYTEKYIADIFHKCSLK